MNLSQTRGVYAAHPLGGLRMAEFSALGAASADGEVFGYEGLYAFGSSIIPTSLGVNPSLTIAAVAERAAERLVARAGDLGLPAAPEDQRAAVPREVIGPGSRRRVGHGHGDGAGGRRGRVAVGRRRARGPR